MQGTSLNGGLRIKPVSASDLAGVARVHCAAFPASALTALGREAVRRYYDWQLSGPHDAVSIAAVRSAELVGFCVAGRFNGAMSGFLRKNRLFLAARVLTHPSLVCNPLVRDRLALALRLLKRRHGGPKAKPRQASFDVLSIAVDPRIQGSGGGKLLLDECEAEAARRGFRVMNLSVETGNLRAVRFYERNGWTKTPADGPWTGRMTKVLGSGGEA